MRAVVISRFGGPEELELVNVRKPTPGRNEIGVAVHAAAVNPVDVGNRRWAGIRLPAILGSDFSGAVEAIGTGVEAWVPGDEVFGVARFRGDGNGTYAEYRVADA